MSFQINKNEQRRVSLKELIQQRDQQRLPLPMPLERDLLIKRIKAGGHSGQFLGDAFLSAYRTGRPFQHSLGELNRLDAEGFRLFHEVLHIKSVSQWSDSELFDIEYDIKIIMSTVDHPKLDKSQV